MTLVIASSTSEGTVLTADSRTSYTNRSGLPRIASDNATKIVEIATNAAVGLSGPAFFLEDGKVRSTQAYLRDFAQSIGGAIPGSVLEIAHQLDAFFRTTLERIVKSTITIQVNNEHGTMLAFQQVVNGRLPYAYISAAAQNISKEWVIAAPSFIVMGRGPDGTCSAISIVPFQGTGVTCNTQNPNLIWIGDSSVVNKLLVGPEAFVLNSSTMNVQDAIDLSIVLTRTTENIQKFSDGVTGSQGGAPTVGGPIDVVYLPKTGNLVWLSQKTLHGESP